MDKCLNCGGELEHIEGRKKKKYCDEVCKGTHWAKTHKKEPKYVQYKTFKDLSDKFNAIAREKILTPEEEMELATYKANTQANGTLPVDITESLPDNSYVLKQIADIKAEKIPKERDTSVGRKVWASDQRKRILELEGKLT